MKVRFDATFEDFVDVCRRSQSQSTSWSSYIVLLGSIVLVDGAMASLIHWLFENWITTIMAAVAGCVAGAWGLIGYNDNAIRIHLKKQVDEKTPVPTEVEITEDGVTTKCLGHSLAQEWSTIERIEETDDAIYFVNKFGQYASARKRGFASPEEMKTFIDLANSYVKKAGTPVN